MESVKLVMPGDNLTVNVVLMVRLGLASGVRFTLREGRLTIGAGIVIEVLD